MNSTNSTKQHKKVRLSGNDDCCVVFCPECNVLELNLGASTVRINPESLHTLSSTLNHAKVRLDQLQNASSANGNIQQIRMGRAH
jgi:hypothetical protein